MPSTALISANNLSRNVSEHRVVPVSLRDR